MHQQLYKSARDASLDHSLDLVVGAVGKVRDGPARIDENFVIQRVDQLCEDRKSGLDLSTVSRKIAVW
jgi:hypothetical protein